MIEKRILRPERRRVVPRSFSWIDHRLLRDGHLERLQPAEALLYFFLVLVADRDGLSYYALPSIARILKLPAEALERARTSLCHRSLIAFSAPLYQVLSLPQRPDAKPLATNAQAKAMAPPPAARWGAGEPRSLADLLDALTFRKDASCGPRDLGANAPTSSPRGPQPPRDR